MTHNRVTTALVMLTALLVGLGISSSSTLSWADDAAQDPGAKAEPSQSKAPAATEPPADQPKRETDPWDQPTAEDMVDELRRQRPKNEIIPPTAPSMEDAGARPATARALLPEGEEIVRRAGRVVRDGPWWTFAFESDHPDHPEPPLRLLPNSKLEQMAHLAASTPTGLVFVASGEVTAFEGQNYLLVRVFWRQPNTGNLTK